MNYVGFSIGTSLHERPTERREVRSWYQDSGRLTHRSVHQDKGLRRDVRTIGKIRRSEMWNPGSELGMLRTLRRRFVHGRHENGTALNSTGP